MRFFSNDAREANDELALDRPERVSTPRIHVRASRPRILHHKPAT